MITPIVVRVVFRTHLPELHELIPVGLRAADSSSFDSLSELPEAIRRLTIFPEPLLQILLHLKVSDVECPSLVIDVDEYLEASY